MGKRLPGISTCLLLCFVLAACGTSTRSQPTLSNATVQSSPNVPLATTTGFSPSHAPSRPTVTAALESGQTLEFTETQFPTIIITPSQISIPAGLPTIELTRVPGLLEGSLSVEILKSSNGQNMQRISGWEYGFAGYQWLDEDHLLLRLVVGQNDSPNFGTIVDTYPAVINLHTNKIWFPPTAGATPWDLMYGYLPHWSARLGKLVTQEMSPSGYYVAIYDPDGNETADYPGELLGVSPTGTKILLAGDTWIDLITGKIVDFAWYQENEAFYFPRPIWSPGETRVYTCCYLYGDASSGISYGMPANQFSVDGKDVVGALFHSYGEWVLGDKYLLVQWDSFYDTNPGFIPLFDPAAKTYRNLNELAGIPADADGIPNCNQTSPSPDGIYVWIECYSGNYLVNLATFKYQAYPGLTDVEIHWSADSQFAWLENLNTDGDHFQILAVSNKGLKPLPANSLAPAWHPIQSILASIAEDQRSLSLINAGNGAVQKVGLPMAFKEVIWSPTGDRIALLAEDGSLWQIDYHNPETPEQLTQSMPDVTDITWSPDGTTISFISNTDIYIVEVLSNS